MNQSILKKYLLGEFSIQRLIRSTMLIYLLLLILVYVFSDQLIFQPPPSSYNDDARIIKLKTPDGLIVSATFFPGPKSGYTILYNHANAVDLGEIESFLVQYQKLGVSVFAYDYSGYGTSSGKSTTKNACKAADAALAYLIESKKISPDRIILHGRSVGGGPALYLASQNEVAGIIIESTFVSAFRVLTQIPLTPFDKFRNLSRVDDINCPVLIIHGRDDQTIPFWHGEKLFEKARDPKTNCWMDRATHNSIPPEAQRKYWASIDAFINQVNSTGVQR